MKGHKHEMSRPCQMCIDQGNLSTMVAPEWLLSHIQSAHQMMSPPPQVPLIRASALAAPLQPTERSSAPASGVWELEEWSWRNGEQWVVCPFCTGKGNTTMKAKNIKKHLSKHHPLFNYQKRQCQGCKVAVLPGQVGKHIFCKQPTTTNGTHPLKRKATNAPNSSLTPAKVARLCGSATMQQILNCGNSLV